VIGRKDFVFTIGYDGSTAVVDGALRRRYGSLGTVQLAEQGLFKQAVCSAVYDAAEDPAAGSEPLRKVLEVYNSRAEVKLASVEELQRVFGVFEVPEGITRLRFIA